MSEGLPKCLNPYLEPEIQYILFFKCNVVPIIEDRKIYFFKIQISVPSFGGGREVRVSQNRPK